MTTGIKISKPGKSINSTDPRDFVLHSQYNSVIIYKEAEVSVTIPANSSVKSTVNYYLPDGTTPVTFDFIPIVYLFVELTAGSGRWYNAPFTMLSSDDPEETYIVLDGATDTAVEASKFFITFHNTTGSSKTIKYRYYILANL